MKHTKGPWRPVSYNGTDWLVESDNAPSYREISPKCSDPIGEKIYICRMHRCMSKNDSLYSPEGAKILSEINRLNAHLIAAAPDLLEALQRIVQSAPFMGLPLALEKDIATAADLITRIRKENTL